MPRRSKNWDEIILNILKNVGKPVSVEDITKTYLKDDNPKLKEFRAASSSIRHAIKILDRGQLINKEHRGVTILYSFKK